MSHSDTKIYLITINLRIKGATRQPKAMKFNEAGKFIQLAQKQRAQSKLEELQRQIAATAKKTGISTVAKRVMLTDDNLAVRYHYYSPSLLFGVSNLHC